MSTKRSFFQVQLEGKCNICKHDTLRRWPSSTISCFHYIQHDHGATAVEMRCGWLVNASQIVMNMDVQHLDASQHLSCTKWELGPATQQSRPGHRSWRPRTTWSPVQRHQARETSPLSSPAPRALVLHCERQEIWYVPQCWTSSFVRPWSVLALGSPCPVPTQKHTGTSRQDSIIGGQLEIF